MKECQRIEIILYLVAAACAGCNQAATPEANTDRDIALPYLGQYLPASTEGLTTVELEFGLFNYKNTADARFGNYVAGYEIHVREEGLRRLVTSVRTIIYEMGGYGMDFTMNNPKEMRFDLVDNDTMDRIAGNPNTIAWTQVEGALMLIFDLRTRAVIGIGRVDMIVEEYNKRFPDDGRDDGIEPLTRSRAMNGLFIDELVNVLLYGQFGFERKDRWKEEWYSYSISFAAFCAAMNMSYTDYLDVSSVQVLPDIYGNPGVKIMQLNESHYKGLRDVVNMDIFTIVEDTSLSPNFSSSRQGDRRNNFLRIRRLNQIKSNPYTNPTWGAR